MKYKVKAIINFNDLEENAHRNIGDIFECNGKRKDYLLEHNAIEVIEEENTKEAIEEIRNYNPYKNEEEKEKTIERAKKEMIKSNKNKKHSKK